MSFFSSLRGLLNLGRGALGGLSEANVGNDPIALFSDWFRTAKRSGILLPEAMAVATSTKDGSPSVRMMLLKNVDQRGFTFYTNYASRKAVELAENPQAALVFHWPTLQRQVRVEGPVTRLSPDEAAAYFSTRTRGSRIGSWASKQSAPMSGRDELDNRVREYEQRFAGSDVPLPPFWGGYRLQPQKIEFWQGRINRLHDRLRFSREGDKWTLQRLFP